MTHLRRYLNLMRCKHCMMRDQPPIVALYVFELATSRLQVETLWPQLDQGGSPASIVEILHRSGCVERLVSLGIMGIQLRTPHETSLTSQQFIAPRGLRAAPNQAPTMPMGVCLSDTRGQYSQSAPSQFYTLNKSRPNWKKNYICFPRDWRLSA